MWPLLGLDFLISLLSTVILYVALKFFGFNKENAIMIAVIIFIIFFIFSMFFTLYIQRIKQKINFLNSQIEKLRKFDETTNVYSRNFLYENLKKYYNISKRKEIPLSLMIISIDDFKKINEIEGYEKGNLILKEISEILRNNMRGMDIIGRYNSDEFLIASFSTKEEFLKLAQRIHKLLKENINISISIGIAQKDRYDTLQDLLRKVQEAVFLARKKGGDRIDILEHFLLIE